MLCREGSPNERAAGREIVAFTCSHFHKLLHPPTRLRFMHTFEALINDTHCREKKKTLHKDCVMQQMHMAISHQIQHFIFCRHYFVKSL